MKTNELNIWKLLRTGFCCTLVVGMVACGGAEEAETDTEVMEETAVVEDDAGVMDNWDNERFNTSFTETGRFAGWDENDDNLLDENEFYGSYYDTWDVNDDNILDENEWTTASRDYGVEGQNWADWDVNKDNKLDENEFRTGAAKNNYYRDWDKNQDKMLDEREYSEGIFSTWDADRDGSITNDEYNTRYNRYYGNEID